MFLGAVFSVGESISRLCGFVNFQDLLHAKEPAQHTQEKSKTEKAQ